MNEPDIPVEELLSAYLAGDLDDAAAAALEARLSADPDLAARLETTHEVVVALRALDDVRTPAGYDERLRARLAAARQAPDDTPVAATRQAPDDAPVASLERRRSRRAERLTRWAGVGTAAAAVAALAVLGGGALLRGGGESGRDVAMPVAGEGRAHGEAEGEAQGDAPSFAQAPAPGPAEEFGDPAGERPQGLQTDGAVFDTDADLPDDAAVRAHFSGLDYDALGAVGADAVERARASQAAVRAAAPLASGVHPAACLDVVTGDTAGPIVVARVESVRYRAQPALAYVLVGASGESDTLDRVEVWILQPAGCVIQLFQTVR